MKYSFLMAVLLSVAFVSCDKNDGDDDGGTTKTQLITSAAWKYDNASVDQDRNGTGDFPVGSFLPACLLDNTIKFETNGTGTASEGTIICSGAPSSTAITWNFANSEGTLVLGGGGIAGLSGQLKILELTENRLTLSKDTSIGIFTNAAIILQLKH